MPSLYPCRIVRLSLAFAFLAVPLFSAPTWSQTLSVDQLTRRASVIVEGEVVSVQGDWNAEHTRIYTTVRLQVANFHKGNTGQNTMDLRLLGGTVGDMAMVVVDQPTFQPGERVFLFLNPNFETRDIPVVGQYQGKLQMTTNARGADVLQGISQTFEKGDVVTSIRNVMRPVGQ